ncbi:MAG: large subunit ribosomal protein L22 [Acidimicrobiales bacterium]|jgi:large subunit ribosomal protein L22
MTGAKTNERPGTKAQVRYLRMSASKARVVLDLVRDKHVGDADQILQFSERLAAKEIQKVLRSAVANAVHNDEIPAEELYVSACYADEGPTLKRFRPRARGRAGPIHKQTCHITVIVSRLSDDKLEMLRNRAERRGQAAGGGASRSDRVAKSRGEETAQPEAEEAIETDEADVAEDAAASAETAEIDATGPVEAEVVEVEVVEEEAAESVAEAEVDDASDTGDTAVEGDEA